MYFLHARIFASKRLILRLSHFNVKTRHSTGELCPASVRGFTSSAATFVAFSCIFLVRDSPAIMSDIFFLKTDISSGCEALPGLLLLLRPPRRLRRLRRRQRGQLCLLRVPPAGDGRENPG